MFWLSVLAVFATAGCFGGDRDAVPSPPVTPVPATDMVISYPLGSPVRNESDLPDCLTGATCTVLQLPHSCPKGAVCKAVRARIRIGWVKVVRRHLTCSPAGGGYPDPAAACAALGDLVERLETGGPLQPICDCAYTWPPAQAKGRYQSRHRTIGLDGCSLCGLGTAAAHVASVLMPQT